MDKYNYFIFLLICSKISMIDFFLTEGVGQLIILDD